MARYLALYLPIRVKTTRIVKQVKPIAESTYNTIKYLLTMIGMDDFREVCYVVGKHATCLTFVSTFRLL